MSHISVSLFFFVCVRKCNNGYQQVIPVNCAQRQIYFYNKSMSFCAL